MVNAATSGSFREREALGNVRLTWLNPHKDNGFPFLDRREQSPEMDNSEAKSLTTDSELIIVFAHVRFE